MLVLAWSLLLASPKMHECRFQSMVPVAMASTVCRDRKLDGLAQRLDAANALILNRLSPGAAVHQAEGMAEFNRWWPAYCEERRRQYGGPPREYASCAENEYADQLDQTRPRSLPGTGFFVYQRMSRNGTMGLKTIDQVDAPDGSSDGSLRERLNAWLRSRSPGLMVAKVLITGPLIAERVSVSAVYRQCVSGSPIFRAVTTRLTAEGLAAHPDETVAYSYYAPAEGLLSVSRILTPDGIDALAVYVLESLRKQQYSVTESGVGLDEIRRYVSDLDFWDIGPSQITVRFNRYAVASYVEGTPEVRLPRRLFIPYLTPVGRRMLGGCPASHPSKKTQKS